MGRSKDLESVTAGTNARADEATDFTVLTRAVAAFVIDAGKTLAAA